ncbi:ABC transporter ATP-binding protein [Aeromicrobium duanguangcaii]|uniref:ABC transporter ATP-binding protein n=1 Tax=Aeromicrobium duanguangcaii TaxID=2968086 RepID=UPI0020170EF1|nr:ABC transporter ATP-binding protein [Aeromicrobium duanguangcaii]MCL3836622.1 ABC transporter ATP-binding protein [Aeromicrobium duanguangcaii]
MTAQEQGTNHTPLVATRGVTVRYGSGRRGVVALEGIDLEVRRGEVLGLVGESGSGKSTLGAVLGGLLAPTDGTVTYDGAPLLVRRGRRSRDLARRRQIVFQNPRSALNPLRTIGDSLTEGPRLTLGLSRDGARERAVDALADVGIEPDALDRYPDAFSGGQRQRIAIARALAMDPEFLICDEVVSSLDLSVQAQVLNLLADLGRRRQLTHVFISHDLTVVRHLSDRIAVLDGGRLVEVAGARQVHENPAADVTRRLWQAIPSAVVGEGGRDGRP